MNNQLKKVGVLLVVCALLCVPSLVLRAEEEEIVPVSNASFEEVTEDGQLKNWSFGQTTMVSLDTTKAHTGKNSLKIECSTGVAPWAAQNVRGFVPGGTYEVSAWVNTMLYDVTNRGTGFKAEYYDAQGTNTGGSTKETYLLSTNGLWTHISDTFTVPEDTDYVRIYCRIMCNGTAWYDDVEIRQTGGPEHFSTYNDHVFLYPDEEGGTATVSLNDYYKGQGVEDAYTVDFEIFDGETVVASQLGTTFQNGKAVYAYKTADLSKLHEKYVLRTSINGEKPQVMYDNLYVYERPTSMHADGSFFMRDGDGKEFNPVFAYHVEIEAYPYMAEAGINTVTLGIGCAPWANDERREMYMDTAKENGLKLLFPLYLDMKMAGAPENIDNTRKIVEAYKDDDRILGWVVMDEPMGSTVTEEKKHLLEESYKAIRELDQYHPIYAVDYANQQETIKYTDMFAADVYCLSEDTAGITNVLGALNGNYRVSTYELAATFKLGGKFPPTNTIRNSVYRAMETGSRGVGYYSISDAIGHDQGDIKTPLYKLDMWDDFKRLNNEEVPILMAHFGRREGIRFNEHAEGTSPRDFLWYQWFVGDTMYLLAHNRNTEPIETTIPLESANGRIIIGDFSAQPVGLTTQKAVKGNGSISIQLAKNEIALYTITTAEKVDFTDINKTRFTDLAGYEWAEAQIGALSAAGVVNSRGDGLYAPGEHITRGEFAMFLIRALGLSATGENFADVARDAAYATEVAVGKALGILNGVGDNLFQPENAITRQEVMTLCARAMEYVGKRTKGEDTVLERFPDRALIASWAAEAARDMVASKIVEGNTDGTCNPLGNTTRAEAAVLAQRVKDAPVVAAQGKPTEQEEPDEVVEFSGDMPLLSHWENAKQFLIDFGMTTAQDCKKSITWGQLEKIVSDVLGYAYTSGQDVKRAVTYEAAMEAAVALVGYDVYAAHHGGTLTAAASAGLTDKVGTGENGYLQSGAVYMLLRNALETKLFEPTAYGSGGEGEYRYSDDTLLTKQFKVRLYEGTVDANYYTTLTGEKAGKDMVRLNGELFGVGKTNAAELLGCTVRAYIADDEIRHIETKNSFVIWNAADIAKDKSTITRLVKYDENNNLQTISFAQNAPIVVNGTLKASPIVADITPQNGTVTMVTDGSGTALCVFAEHFTNYVVDKTDAEDSKVYCKDGTTLTLDITEQKHLRLQRQDGTAFAVVDLAAWNILSVETDENGTIQKAILVTEKVSGVPTETDADGVTVGQVRYEYAPDAAIQPIIGKQLTFYLDFQGQIAAMNEEIVPDYAYFVNMTREKGIGDRVQLKLFLANGTMKVFTAADKVRLNGNDITKETLLASSLLMQDSTTPIGQLIIYETNGKDELLALTTAVPGGNVSAEDREHVFTKDMETGNVRELAICDGFGPTLLGSRYVIKDSTVTFIVPFDYSDDEENYAVKSIGRYQHGFKTFNATIYDVDKDRGIGAVVEHNTTIEEVGTDGEYGIVIGTREVWNEEDGTSSKAVVLYGRYGDEIVLAFRQKDFTIQLGSACITTPATDTEVEISPIGQRILKDYTTPDKLNVGDVVQYVADGKNYVKGMRVIFRAESPRICELSEEGLGEYYYYSARTRAYASVKTIGKYGITIKPGQWERFFPYSGATSSTAQIALYDSAAQTVKNVDRSKIEIGDKIFVLRINPYTRIMMLCR